MARPLTVAIENADGSASALVDLRRLVEKQSETLDEALPTERDLAAWLGIGRRAIRQNPAVLEAEGQIWRRQGKGAFVAPAAALTPLNLGRVSRRTNFFEVMEVRLHVEPILVQLATLGQAPNRLQ